MSEQGDPGPQEPHASEVQSSPPVAGDFETGRPAEGVWRCCCCDRVAGDAPVVPQGWRIDDESRAWCGVCIDSGLAGKGRRWLR